MYAASLLHSLARAGQIGLVVIAAATTASAQVDPDWTPVCSSQTGVDHWNQLPLAGGLTLYHVSDAGARDADYSILAHCGSATQVSVRGLSDWTTSRDVWARVIGMVASSQTYTFEDIRSRFPAPDYLTEIQVIEADTCICPEMSAD